MKRVIITIGREYGSGGRLVAKQLAQRLDVPFYDKELIQKVAKKTGLSEHYIQSTEQRRPTNSLIFDLYTAVQTPSVPEQVFIAQAKVIKEAAEQGSCVIVGRCADYVLRDYPDCLRVFVSAPMDQRVRRAHDEYGVDQPNIESYVIRQDKIRASYYNYYATGRWGDRSSYDLCVNTRIGIENAVSIIEAAARALSEEIR